MMDKQAETTIRLDLDTQQLASQYDIMSDYQYGVGVILANMLDISPSERVLDIGAGTGRLTSYVANIVGHEGRVIGIDPLKDRINVACKKTQPNLSFLVGDAHDLSSFDSGAFDVVFFNCVFHWLHDQARALRECFRVLKPGGRLGISTPSKDHPFYPFEVKKSVLSTEGYRQYSETTNGEIKMFNESDLGGLLNKSGFTSKTISSHPGTILSPDSESLLNLLHASSFGNFLGHLPEELQNTASEDIQETFERLRTDDGIPIEVISLVALAVKD